MKNYFRKEFGKLFSESELDKFSSKSQRNSIDWTIGTINWSFDIINNQFSYIKGKHVFSNNQSHLSEYLWNFQERKNANTFDIQFSSRRTSRILMLEPCFEFEFVKLWSWSRAKCSTLFLFNL